MSWYRWIDTDGVILPGTPIGYIEYPGADGVWNRSVLYQQVADDYWADPIR